MATSVLTVFTTAYSAVRGLDRTTVALHVPEMSAMSRLEHVVAALTLRHSQRRLLEIWLVSPQGTVPCFSGDLRYKQIKPWCADIWVGKLTYLIRFPLLLLNTTTPGMFLSPEHYNVCFRHRISVVDQATVWQQLVRIWRVALSVRAFLGRGTVRNVATRDWKSCFCPWPTHRLQTWTLRTLIFYIEVPRTKFAVEIARVQIVTIF
jgi:hypothetical protein